MILQFSPGHLSCIIADCFYTGKTDKEPREQNVARYRFLSQRLGNIPVPECSRHRWVAGKMMAQKKREEVRQWFS